MHTCHSKMMAKVHDDMMAYHERTMNPLLMWHSKGIEPLIELKVD